jgi:hypothetical protein
MIRDYITINSNSMKQAAALILIALAPAAPPPAAVRFKQNPLITQQLSPSLGDNINGPSVIRVPSWIHHPLGRYYLYFAHHKGDHIRLAYANNLAGPWKIYEPGVLNVKDTAFYRPQPDPPAQAFYTHVASPEVVVDDSNKRLVMFVHGMFTDGKRWPDDPQQATRWARENGYAQYTQTTVSADGLNFAPRPGITARTSYSRLFRWHDTWYNMARLGILSRANDLLATFEAGPNPFDGGPYVGRVRHVATLLRGDTLYVFFSGIGDAPERILLSTISLSSDWRSWRASTPIEVLRPQAKYECTELPIKPSKIGEAEGPEHALRDPAVIEENGRVILFYSYCGEQGLSAADVTSLIR